MAYTHWLQCSPRLSSTPDETVIAAALAEVRSIVYPADGEVDTDNPEIITIWTGERACRFRGDSGAWLRWQQADGRGEDIPAEPEPEPED